MVATSPSRASGSVTQMTDVLNLASGGTWGVSVGEVDDVGLSSFDQPLGDSPAHGFIDFDDLGRGAIESKAKLLRARARARGCLYRPPE